MFWRWLVGTIMVFSVGSVLWAEAREDAIREAEKTWANAVLARDAGTLERVMAEDLIYAHSSGIVENKREYLRKLQSGLQQYELIDYRDVTVRLHDGTAVAHSFLRMKGRNPKGPFDDQLMMLHVWVRRDGRWQLAAHQTTKLPPM